MPFSESTMLQRWEKGQGVPEYKFIMVWIQVKKDRKRNRVTPMLAQGRRALTRPGTHRQFPG